MFRRISLAGLLLLSSESYSFPEMISHGYNSCKACHLDSSGGGPLTPYGRTIASEILSTWSFGEKEGEAFYGLFDPRPFGVAGDFRTLFDRYEDSSVKVTQRFPMQREVSLTFDPAKNVSFVGSVGLYGPEAVDYEYRRYYGKITLGHGIGIRAGRFMPAFGILIPDHTKSTRELFSQGDESLNLEVSWTAKYLEVFLTRIAGSNSGITTGSKPAVVQRDDRNGYAAKVSLFLKPGVQFGASFATLTDDATTVRNYGSYHLFLGNERVWLYGEVQSWPGEIRKSYGNLGIAFTKGVWLAMEVDARTDEETRVWTTLRLFPRPHFELTLSADKKEMFVVSHYYL